MVAVDEIMVGRWAVRSFASGLRCGSQGFMRRPMVQSLACSCTHSGSGVAEAAGHGGRTAQAIRHGHCVILV